MKLISVLIVGIMAFAASGCRIIEATGPGESKVMIQSIGNTTSWGRLAYDPNTGGWVVENFNNDQAAAYIATLNLLGQLAAMAAKGGVAQTSPPPTVIRNSFQAVNP